MAIISGGMVMVGGLVVTAVAGGVMGVVVGAKLGCVSVTVALAGFTSLGVLEVVGVVVVFGDRTLDADVPGLVFLQASRPRRARPNPAARPALRTNSRRVIFCARSGIFCL